MAKSRYSPELTEIICNAIAVSGTDEAGWIAGEISKPTFYTWANRFPDFLDAVNTAKTEYRKSGTNNIKRLGKKALLDYLEGRMTKTSYVKKQVLSPAGDVVELEAWRTAPVGVPQWAVVRALGEDITEVEALSRLAELNLIPSWVVDCAERILDKAREEISTILRAELPEPLAYELAKEREQSGGLSAETVGRIRAEIMGIDAQSISALSVEGDEHSRQGADLAQK